MNRAVILTLGALLAGCAAGAASKAPGARAPAEAAPPTLLVEVLRKGCVPCGFYRLEFDTDGEVRFHSSTCAQEPEVVRLPPGSVVAVRRAIALSAFATTPKHCCDNCFVEDESDLALTVADGAEGKTIIDKGCSPAVMTVRDLADTIEKIIGIERWIDPDQELVGPCG